MKLMESARIGELPKGKVGPLAQLVEQRTFNPWVDGSSPSGPTFPQRHNDHLELREVAGQIKIMNQGDTMHQTTLLDSTPISYFKLLRIDHWIKNLFMIPGVAIAYSLEFAPYDRKLDFGLIVSVGLGLFILCLASSANYVINEWLDREDDAKHPFKNHRVSNIYNFSGKSVFVLYIMILVLVFFGLRFVNQSLALYVGLLLVMGVLYNVKPFRLKDRHYLDVISESVNNPIRLSIGWHSLVSDLPVPVSAFIGFWGIGVFIMALKRYSEMTLISDDRLLGMYRKSFKHWTTQKLLVFSMVGALTGATFMGIFLVRNRVEYIFLFPFLIWIFAEYLKLSLNLNPASYAPEKLMKDKKLVTLSLLLGGFFIFFTFYSVPMLETILNLGSR
jgi:decaprenyl-phosphate phosphoribosyltransferase